MAALNEMLSGVLLLLITVNLASCAPNRWSYCARTQFKCRDGDCIPKKYVCDGINDCSDRSDEEGCPTKAPPPACPKGALRCSSGECIKLSFQCDGDGDCSDGSDELGCSQQDNGCLKGQFACADRSCIKLSRVCDGHRDCPEGSDEAVCSHVPKWNCLVFNLSKFDLLVGGPSRGKTTKKKPAIGEESDSGAALNPQEIPQVVAEIKPTATVEAIVVSESPVKETEERTTSDAAPRQKETTEPTKEIDIDVTVEAEPTAGAPLEISTDIATKVGNEEEKIKQAEVVTVTELEEHIVDASTEPNQTAEPTKEVTSEVTVEAVPTAEGPLETDRDAKLEQEEEKTIETDSATVNVSHESEQSSSDGSGVEQNVFVQGTENFEAPDDENIQTENARTVTDDAEQTTQTTSIPEVVKIVESKIETEPSPAVENEPIIETIPETEPPTQVKEEIATGIAEEAETKLEPIDETTFETDQIIESKIETAAIETVEQTNEAIPQPDQVLENLSVTNTEPEKSEISSESIPTTESSPESEAGDKVTTAIITVEEHEKSAEVTEKTQQISEIISEVPAETQNVETDAELGVQNASEEITKDVTLKKETTAEITIKYDQVTELNVEQEIGVKLEPEQTVKEESKQTIEVASQTTSDVAQKPEKETTNEEDGPSDCSKNMFTCTVRTCVNLSYLCDGDEDCPDGSDELDCSREGTVCLKGQFTCTDRSCVKLTMVCDGEEDCSDGADEVNCNFTQPQSNSTEPVVIVSEINEETQTSTVIESKTEIEGRVTSQGITENVQVSETLTETDTPVLSEPMTNIIMEPEHISEVVEEVGHKMEPEGTVEIIESNQNNQATSEIDTDIKLETSSTTSEITASTGQVSEEIPEPQQVTEGAVETDQVTESAADVSTTVNVEPAEEVSTAEQSVEEGTQEIKNETESVAVIKPEKIVKSAPTLQHAIQVTRESETTLPVKPQSNLFHWSKSCARHQFRCKNAECISQSYVCDDDIDCDDGSDEENCPTKEPIHCPNNTFTCAVGTCVKISYLCDGEDDCPDGSDELNCHREGTVCLKGQFTCTDRSCVKLLMVCDGEEDCPDGADEFNCNGAQPIQQQTNITEPGLVVGVINEETSQWNAAVVTATREEIAAPENVQVSEIPTETSKVTIEPNYITEDSAGIEINVSQDLGQIIYSTTSDGSGVEHNLFVQGTENFEATDDENIQTENAKTVTDEAEQTTKTTSEMEQVSVSGEIATGSLVDTETEPEQILETIPEVKIVESNIETEPSPAVENEPIMETIPETEPPTQVNEEIAIGIAEESETKPEPIDETTIETDQIIDSKIETEAIETVEQTNEAIPQPDQVSENLSVTNIEPEKSEVSPESIPTTESTPESEAGDKVTTAIITVEEHEKSAEVTEKTQQISEIISDVPAETLNEETDAELMEPEHISEVVEEVGHEMEPERMVEVTDPNQNNQVTLEVDSDIKLETSSTTSESTKDVTVKSETTTKIILEHDQVTGLNVEQEIGVKNSETIEQINEVVPQPDEVLEKIEADKSEASLESIHTEGAAESEVGDKEEQGKTVEAAGENEHILDISFTAATDEGVTELVQTQMDLEMEVNEKMKPASNAETTTASEQITKVTSKTESITNRLENTEDVLESEQTAQKQVSTEETSEEWEEWEQSAQDNDEYEWQQVMESLEDVDFTIHDEPANQLISHFAAKKLNENKVRYF